MYGFLHWAHFGEGIYKNTYFVSYFYAISTFFSVMGKLYTNVKIFHIFYY